MSGRGGSSRGIGGDEFLGDGRGEFAWQPRVSCCLCNSLAEPYCESHTAAFEVANFQPDPSTIRCSQCCTIAIADQSAFVAAVRCADECTIAFTNTGAFCATVILANDFTHGRSFEATDSEPQQRPDCDAVVCSDKISYTVPDTRSIVLSHRCSHIHSYRVCCLRRDQLDHEGQGDDDLARGWVGGDQQQRVGDSDDPGI